MVHLALKDYESAFQKLNVTLSTQISPRLKLLLLEQFSALLMKRENQTLNISYYEELWPLYHAAIRPNTLQYQSPERLQVLKGVLELVSVTPSFQELQDEIQTSLGMIRDQQIRLLLYLRVYDKILDLLELDSHVIHTTNDSGEIIDPRTFLNLLQVHDLPPEVLKTIQNISTYFQDRLHQASAVFIPLVEQLKLAPDDTLISGTLYPLTVDIESRKRDRSRDLIMFNNHPISQDDLVNYQAQDAIRAARGQHVSLREAYTSRYTVSFGFPETDHQFVGSSFGLGMSLLTLCAMEKESNFRKQHRIREGTVFTGGVDLRGGIREVSHESLQVKIEAAFFSSMHRMVIPRENMNAARHILDELQRQYPHKPFELISEDDLSGLVRNKQVMSYATLPLSTWSKFYFTRNRVIRYVAATFLLALLVLIGLKVTLDRNPAAYKVEGETVNIFNKNDVFLWSFPMGFTPKSLEEPLPKKQAARALQIHDYDGDGKNEIILGTRVKDHKFNGQLFYFESDGSLAWSFNSHPKLSFGGEQYTDNYGVMSINPFQHAPSEKHEFYVRFSHMPWFPNRLIRFDIAGRALNEFIHPGTVYDIEFLDLNKDGEYELLLGGTNNNFNSAFLTILPSRSFSGTAPPWKNTRTLDGGWVDSSLVYIKFPAWGIYDITGSGARTHLADIFPDSDDEFTVTIDLGSTGGSGAYIYHFGHDLSLKGLSMSDGFFSFHQRETGEHFFETFDRETWYSKMTTLDIWKQGEWTILTDED